ncbi:PIN domain-containing protein [Aurantimonas sp. 22II-16-19i]|uniref:PIN domain-containing protein n=1 Tax=Aurantimonas sp. 22II-16-19i TaxID=1317114 RepID=UPI0009F7AB1E|nr:PIN domain-containing protein [Aurantimonas sp. 22II-16-19i]ORE91612.1 PilT protein-like protein [Aurantimonas sp. 22II-16-19i]
MIAGADVFLDTNILIYAATAQASEPDKWQVAHGLLTTQFGTSGQVLAEFYANATRKPKPPLPPDDARRWVSLLGRKPFVVVDERLVLAGIDLSQRYQISYWDGAIVAAAERLGAKTLYTEDLSHGQAYGPVTAINPFL